MFAFTEIHRTSPEKPFTYSDLLKLQDERIEQLRSGASSPGILLGEVEPIITYGLRTDPKDIWAPPRIQRLSVDRGGLATYHGPGQWLLFPVVHVPTWTGERIGVRRALTFLLEAACAVGRSYGGRKTSFRWGVETGAWSDRGKFAAIGVRIRDSFLRHGIAINGFRAPGSFEGLKPCGLDAPVDFLLDSPDGFLGLGERLADRLTQGASISGH